MLGLDLNTPPKRPHRPNWLKDEQTVVRKHPLPRGKPNEGTHQGEVSCCRRSERDSLRQQLLDAPQVRKLVGPRGAAGEDLPRGTPSPVLDVPIGERKRHPVAVAPPR